MRFKLVEEALLEMPTKANYRETLISIVDFVASLNKEFAITYSYLIKKVKSGEVEFHHVDGKYSITANGHKKVENNHVSNVALVTKDYHNETRRKGELRPMEKEDGILLKDLLFFIKKSTETLESSAVEEANKDVNK